MTGYLEALAEHKALDSSAKGKMENEETTPSKQQGRGQGHDRQKQGTSRPAVNVNEEIWNHINCTSSKLQVDFPWVYVNVCMFYFRCAAAEERPC